MSAGVLRSLDTEQLLYSASVLDDASPIVHELARRLEEAGTSQQPPCDVRTLQLRIAANGAGPRDLAELANRINAAAHAAEAGARAAVIHAVAAGHLLAQAKARVGHGGWAAWLADHCTVAPRTASAYMKLAGLPDEIGNAVADLPLRLALRAIAARAEAPPSVARGPARAPDELDCAEAALEAGRQALAKAKARLRRRRYVSSGEAADLEATLAAAMRALGPFVAG